MIPFIKVCGMRDAENIKEIESLGVDWMGFIFCEHSPRHVSQRPTYLPEKAKRIGVFVNASFAFISQKTTEYKLNGIQLHGTESPEFCQALHRLPISGETKQPMIIKAFNIKQASDFACTTDYESCCDFFLFDTPCSTFGGSGQSFDWTLLQHYQGKVPFVLSGGISIESLPALRLLHHTQWQGIDVNSRFEHSPALKDKEALQLFINQLKAIKNESD